MKDENDLDNKYLVIKLNDIKKYMSFDRQEIFWSLFWEMVDTRKIHKKLRKIHKKTEKIYEKHWRKKNG